MSIADELYTQIIDLCGEADEFSINENYAEALPLYEKAWALIPEPKAKHDASTFVIAGLIDACFLTGEFAKTKQYAELAIQQDGSNPFFYILLAKALFELNQIDEAKKQIKQAKQLTDGDDSFFADLDAKYLDLLN